MRLLASLVCLASVACAQVTTPAATTPLPVTTPLPSDAPTVLKRLNDAEAALSVVAGSVQAAQGTASEVESRLISTSIATADSMKSLVTIETNTKDNRLLLNKLEKRLTRLETNLATRHVALVNLTSTHAQISTLFAVLGPKSSMLEKELQAMEKTVALKLPVVDKVSKQLTATEGKLDKFLAKLNTVVETAMKKDFQPHVDTSRRLVRKTGGDLS